MKQKRSKAAAGVVAPQPETRPGQGAAVAPAQPGRPPLWLRFAPLYLTAAIVTVYFPVLGFDFIGLDDKYILKAHFYLLRHLSNWKLAFTTDAFLRHGHFYRPLQTLSFMFDASVGGPGPLIYHLTNMVLHLAGSLCVFWLLLISRYQRVLSLVLALLFALHPLFVPMVAWVPARGDLLLTVFVLLAFILFVKALCANDRRLMALHGVVFFLAFLSKETAVVVPLCCLLYYFLELRQTPGRKLIYQFFPVWVVTGSAWYYLHSLMYSASWSAPTLGLIPLQRNLRILPELFGKFFAPVRFQLVPLFSPRDTLIGTLALLVVLCLVRALRQHTNRRVQLGFCWFLLCLTPVMLFRQSDARYTFDYLYHRAYLPSVGLLMVLAELLTHVPAAREVYRRGLVLVAVALLAYCGIFSSREMRFYTDAPTFFTEAIARTPKSALCHNNRGAYFEYELQDYEAALKDFTLAIELYPAYSLAILNRGLAREYLGRNREALADLELVRRLHPGDPDTLFRMGNLRDLLNDFSGALADYNRLFSVDRLYPRIYSKRAGDEAMLGQAQKALGDADQAIRTDPKDEEAWNSRGLAHRLMGRLDEAINDFTEAISLKTNYSRAFNNRGTVRWAKGDLAQATEDFTRAIQFDSHFAEAFSNRGAAEFRSGKDQAALKDLETAMLLNPDFADAYVNRGQVRMALGSFADARTDFDRALELNPASAQGYLNRGILHVGHLANYDAGTADFRRVLELEPTNTDAALNLGMALYKKREYQAAVNQYSSLLNILPDNARLYYLRALAYGEMRDFTNALKDGTRAKGLGLAIDDALLAKWHARPDSK